MSVDEDGSLVFEGMVLAFFGIRCEGSRGDGAVVSWVCSVVAGPGVDSVDLVSPDFVSIDVAVCP